MSREAEKVTIIIVNWNTVELLRSCLASIRAETRAARYRTLVVDNGSTDGSVAMVRQEFPEVTLIENGENKGFAAANNQGMELARSPYVLLLNSDTVILDDAISKCIEFAEAHLDIGVVGCRLLYPDGSFQSSAFRFPSLWGIGSEALGLARASKRSRLFNFDRYGNRPWAEPRDCDVVMGSFMLVRRAVIEKVGLLMPEYFMYGEETEWCHRIRQAGFRVVHFPEARIVHVHRGSMRSEAQRWWARACVQQSQLLFLALKRGTLPAIAGGILFISGELLRAATAVLRAGAFLNGRQLAEVPWRLRLAGEHLRSLVARRWAPPPPPSPPPRSPGAGGSQPVLEKKGQSITP